MTTVILDDCLKRKTLVVHDGSEELDLYTDKKSVMYVKQ